MDYQKFYAEVVEWINQANQAAVKLGMDNSDFWIWVADSTGTLSRKYQDNRLVIKQMVMLIEWLEEVYEKKNKGKVTDSRI